MSGLLPRYTLSSVFAAGMCIPVFRADPVPCGVHEFAFGIALRVGVGVAAPISATTHTGSVSTEQADSATAGTRDLFGDRIPSRVDSPLTSVPIVGGSLPPKAPRRYSR